MKTVPPSAPVPAQLSNRLADLAERAGEAARDYRRGSIESIAAYLRAGELLAEARGECRRGEWGAVLLRAGIADRTGRLMVQAAKLVAEHGASADDVHDAGGIQAFVAAAAEREKAALSAGFSGVPVDTGDDAPVGAAERLPEPREGGEGVSVPPEPVSGVSGVSGGRTGGHDERTPAKWEVREARAAARVAAGLCSRCGKEPVEPGRRQGARCLERDRARTRERLAGGRFAQALDRRLREAAAKGRGLSLSAADVERLLGDKAKR